MKFSEQLEALYRKADPLPDQALGPGAFLLYVQDELGYLTDEAIEEIARPARS